MELAKQHGKGSHRVWISLPSFFKQAFSANYRGLLAISSSSSLLAGVITRRLLAFNTT